MFGYMTAKEAKELGFTHHGKYFGVPVWLAPDNPDFPVATKWEPMEYVMTLFHWIEQTMRPIMFPDSEPSFQFLIVKEIE